MFVKLCGHRNSHWKMEESPLLWALSYMAGAALWQEPQGDTHAVQWLHSCLLLHLIQRGRGLKGSMLWTTSCNQSMSSVKSECLHGGAFGRLLAANIRRCGRTSCHHGWDNIEKLCEGGTLITQRLTEVQKSEKGCLLVRWTKATLWGFY